MLAKSITISSKGQISLPKEIVKHLDSRALRLEILNDNEVKIIPIRDVAGRLSQYAKNIDSNDWNAVREQAWLESIKGRFSREDKND